jgi:hypothetical protein
MTCHGALPREKKVAMNFMKIEISYLAALFLVGTDLLARAAVQGIEQALLSAAIDWSMNRVRAGRQRFFPPA